MEVENQEIHSLKLSSFGYPLESLCIPSKYVKTTDWTPLTHKLVGSPGEFPLGVCTPKSRLHFVKKLSSFNSRDCSLKFIKAFSLNQVDDIRVQSSRRNFRCACYVSLALSCLSSKDKCVTHVKLVGYPHNKKVLWSSVLGQSGVTGHPLTPGGCWPCSDSLGELAASP